MYGSFAYGSAPFGGLPSAWPTFFMPTERLPEGIHRRSYTYTGSAAFFGIFLHMDSFSETEIFRIIRVYTHNDPGETPQLQTQMSETGDTSVFVGAAQFIVVELELLSDFTGAPIVTLITGREQ